MNALLSGKEGSYLILPPNLKNRLSPSSITTIPSLNIRAGIGYLLMKMTTFAVMSVLDADTKTYEVRVEPGDSLNKIAKVHGSTPEILKKLNPATTVLRPGQVLKYQKGSMEKVIVGRRHISTSSIANFYNGGGDVLYVKKLDYALSLIRKREVGVCSQ